MPRSAKNKQKAWRRDFEIHMTPQEVQSTNEEGEIVKSIVDAPYVLKGRALRDYRLAAMKVKPLASSFLINLMTNAGLVTMVSDAVVPEINENTLEPA